MFTPTKGLGSFPPKWDSVGLGLALRFSGLFLLALAVGSATLTFDWIITHRVESNAVGEFAGAVLYPSDLLLISGVLFWTIGWRITSDFTFRLGPVYVVIPFLILGIMTLLSGLWAPYEIQWAATTIRRFFLIGLFLIMVNDSRRALWPMVVVLFGFGMLHATVAILQILTASSVGLSVLGEMNNSDLGVRIIGQGRAFGLGFNPNPVGAFLAAVSLIAFGLFVFRTRDRLLTLLFLVVFVTTFLGMVTTVSRAAYLGWGVSALFISLLAFSLVGTQWRPVINKIAMLVAGGIAIVIAINVFQASPLDSPIKNDLSESGGANIHLENIYDRVNLEYAKSGFTSRYADWELSFPIIKANLVKGVGSGNYPFALKEHLIPEEFSSIYVPIHNVGLLMLAELGIIGFIAWSVMVLAPMISVVFRKVRGRLHHDELLWLAPLIALLVIGQFEFSLWATQDIRLLFPTVLGLWAGSAK